MFNRAFKVLSICLLLIMSHTCCIGQGSKKEKPGSDKIYSFSLYPATDESLKYYISTDSLKWVERKFHLGFPEIMTYDHKKLFLKIAKGDEKVWKASLQTGINYKVFWTGNKKTWELVTY